MRHLAARHEVTYLSFAEPAEVEAHGAGMSEVCSHLVTVPRRDHPKGSPRFYASVVRHLLDPVPYAVAKYRSPAYRQALDSLLDTGNFDRIVCDFLVPAVNLRGTRPCPAALFTHNVEAEIWRRHADTTDSPMKKMLFRQQWRRMLAFERRTLAEFDRVLAVSDADRDTFDRIYPGAVTAPVSVIPTGVDTQYFTPTAPDAVRPSHLVFVGSMDWLPNEDAMLFFCQDILPRIAAEIPGVTLSIVGRSPTAAVGRLARPGVIEVTGRVDDVRPAMAQAAVVIVPLRIGGGTRLKIFEAMAAGKAVVSTTVGAEGLPCEPGRHLVLADGAAAFASAVVALLRDSERRQAIERDARTLVTERYDWAAVAGDFERALVDTTSPQGHAAPAIRRTAGRPINAS
jgi:glycosyltransferase involved in cell wall biosynthesis